MIAEATLPDLIKPHVCIRRKTDSWVLSMCDARLLPPIRPNREAGRVSEELAVNHGTATMQAAAKRCGLSYEPRSDSYVADLVVHVFVSGGLTYGVRQFLEEDIPKTGSRFLTERVAGIVGGWLRTSLEMDVK